MTVLDAVPSSQVPSSSFGPMKWPAYLATKPLSPRIVSWTLMPVDWPVMVTAPGEQAGPTPQSVPVPETADPAVVKESDTLEPAGFRLNCHSHRPSRLLLGERREWPQPTVVRSTSEASSETRMRTSALDSVGSYTSWARENRVRRYREGPPNGSRLSCGQRTRRAACRWTIVRARQGTTTPVPLRAIGPSASSAC